MNRQTEELLRAAFEAKADQVTDERLDQLAVQRQRLLTDGLDGMDWDRSESSAGISLFQDRAEAGDDLTPLDIDHGFGGTRHARWLAPVLAAAAVAAVAVAVTAISTVADNGKHAPIPPATGISTSAPSTSAPSLTPTPSSTPTQQPTSNGHPSAATPPAKVALLGNGKQADRSQVPWSQVGPGWSLALWTPSTVIDKNAQGAVLRDAPESLFLVNPVGGRYLITTLPVGHFLELKQWSGDGRRASFARRVPNANSATSTNVELNLETGAQHEISVSGRADFSYTKPLGLAMLVSRDSGLERVGLDGTRQLLYPTSYPGVGKVSGGYYSPDGSQLVRNIDDGWVVITNDGTVVRTLTTPTGAPHCSYHRWWTTTTVLMTCYPGPTSDDPRLWLVSITGASATPLPTPQAGLGEFSDAIRVGSQTFLEATASDGAFHCDGTDLAALLPDGKTRALNFRQRTGTSQGIHFLQATPQRLYLTTNLRCGQSQQIISYDPRTDELSTLLGGSVNGGSIIQALGYRATDPPE